MLVSGITQPIILASRSPRRRELLQQIGVPIEILDLEVDESVIDGEAALDYVCRIARNKASSAWQSDSFQGLPDYESRAILAADTCVVLENRILGKPENPEAATEMLSSLAGRSHQVITAVALADKKGVSLTQSITEVEFSDLSPEEVAAYVATGESLDKAGGYGIQGVAAQFVKSIHGSYSGVVGLPLYETCCLLKQHFTQAG